MEFDWDKQKAAENLANYGVSFDEAKTVFDDPLYVDFYDNRIQRDTTPGNEIVPFAEFNIFSAPRLFQ